MGQEGPHSGPWLALGDIKWSLIVPGKGGYVVVDIINVHKHLRWWTSSAGASPQSDLGWAQLLRGLNLFTYKLGLINVACGADAGVIWGHRCRRTF
jgi:hypothetical protein